MTNLAASLIRIGFLLLALVSLNSCGHIARKDGPPGFYVDETKIPNAVPKPETPAKYGNMKSYVVQGKRYHTLKSSKNYKAVGIASWYGKKFHSRKTSSGEPYNMLGMTAAHKTLPLPTYVEVTNLQNHRKVIVKVNDRGPFAPGRIIDLSYVAAKKLGMVGHGTAKVKIKTIDPVSYGSTEPFFADSRTTSHKTLPTHQSFHQQTKPVYLQVGAFRNESYAKKLQKRLSHLVSAPVILHRPALNGHLYRVRIGPFRNVNLIESIAARLKELGITANKTYGV